MRQNLENVQNHKSERRIGIDLKQNQVINLGAGKSSRGLIPKTKVIKGRPLTQQQAYGILPNFSDQLSNRKKKFDKKLTPMHSVFPKSHSIDNFAP